MPAPRGKAKKRKLPKSGAKTRDGRKERITDKGKEGFDKQAIHTLLHLRAFSVQKTSYHYELGLLETAQSIPHTSPLVRRESEKKETMGGDVGIN